MLANPPFNDSDWGGNFDSRTMRVGNRVFHPLEMPTMLGYHTWLISNKSKTGLQQRFLRMVPFQVIRQMKGLSVKI